ncbi:STAS domain-containing protein [Streptomyces sp. WAC06614]|uniref:STAS domain-containing protein n=1 Tax=Streptomyces sp. WAC06614 TaxID=2487416 RepID=UPI00163B7AAA|nr:STAS domain-containing protein [Streptomyces sp. WAC06614]
MVNQHEPSAVPAGTPAGRPGALTCRTGPDGTTVITLVGDLDSDCATRLARAFAEAGHAGSTTVVDCTGITFVGLAVLHVLLDASTAQKLVLAGPLPHPLTVLLDGTQTRGAFTLADTLQDALPADPPAPDQGG